VEEEEEEERPHQELHVKGFADGSRTEWSPSAAGRGRRRRPQLGEGVQDVVSGQEAGQP
jgi:hypothetical protein